MMSTLDSRYILSGALVVRARRNLNMTQTQFAAAINKAVAETGRSSRCSKRLVQKWESGEHSNAAGRYQDAIAAVTGVPYRLLCEPIPDFASGELARLLVETRTQLTAATASLDAIMAIVNLLTPPNTVT